MKVLLDECVHVGLRHEIVGHDVLTVSYLRWKGLKNGALLAKAAAEGFEAFVTTDRGVRSEQHIARLSVAIVILRVESNDLAMLKPLVPQLLAVLNHVSPGTVSFIDLP